MQWIIISVFAYFLNAIALLIDKFLLKRIIPNPAVYAFYVGVLGLLVFVFAPFNFQFPNLLVLILSLAAGVSYIFALLVFYFLLKKGEASRIVPLVGGLSPVFIFILAWLLLQEMLSVIQICAFVLILLGGWLIMWERKKGKTTFPWPVFFLSLLPAFLFALSHVLSKFVYVNFSFMSGLIWRGVGGFLGGMILFLIPQNREKIIKAVKRSQNKKSFIFIFGQTCAAISFVLVNYAFFLGSVTLVNALSGVQYVFLFLIIIILSKKLPQILQEGITMRIIWQKALSLILISLGISLLFL